MKRLLSKKYLNFITIAIAAAVLLALVYKNHGPAGIARQLSQLNGRWILAAFLCMLAYWGYESLALHAITAFLHQNQRFRDSLKVTMIGQFFNSVTPFASGGQPMQLYVMTKDGVKASHAGSILVIRFLFYNIVLVGYSFAALLAAPFYESYSPQLYALVIVGFAVRAAFVAAIVLFSWNRSATRAVLVSMLAVLKRLKLVKDLEKTEEKVICYLSMFHDNIVIFRHNRGLIAKVTVLTVLQLAHFFSIPYCIYRSFGFNSSTLWDMVAAQAFVTSLMTLVPLPGAAGGAEGSFFLLFKKFFSATTIMPALLVWRIVTYYSCIGLGSLVSLFAPRKKVENPEGAG